MPTNTIAEGQFALDVAGLEKLKQAGRRDRQAGLEGAAQQFEALLLHQMLQGMREATPRSDLLDSSQTRFVQGLFDQQLSQHLSGRGLGLAEQLVAQLQRVGK
ncbi:rod-binding protein [Parahaliea mediterranea]|uniref:rod-binding protein n=1 Tax=Parahaliea mediterranea TaxID=651086 RepID=UPI000E2EF4EC|nr:rod-binding protein [Parahaliea mediterranea]